MICLDYFVAQYLTTITVLGNGNILRLALQYVYVYVCVCLCIPHKKQEHKGDLIPLGISFIESSSTNDHL